MRSSKLSLFFAVTVVCLGVCGCIGDINGYMADRDPGVAQKESMIYPATKADVQLLRKISTTHSDSRLGSFFGRPVVMTYLLADTPISIATDTLMLPVVGTGKLIHGTNRTDFIGPCIPLGPTTNCVVDSTRSEGSVESQTGGGLARNR